MLKKTPLKDMIGYSFGGLGFSISNMLMLTYLTFCLTDIFEISPMVVATLMLVSRVVDAVTDPLMGFIADHTKAKMGRYRFWMAVGAPLLGIAIFLLFRSPDLSPTMKIVYVYAIYIFYSLAITIVNIPYYSLTPMMAETSKQRTTVVAWKSMMTHTGRYFITALALPLVKVFGDGKQGWSAFGALVGIMAAVSYLIVIWRSKNYDSTTQSPKEAAKKKENKAGWREFKVLFKNRPLLMLMIAYGTDMIANATMNAANMYYFKYVLNRQDLVPTVATLITVSSIVATVAQPYIVKKWGKKSIYWWGSFLSIAPLAVVMIYPYCPVPVLFVLMAVFGFISAMPSNLAWVMLADCTDYAEWKFNVKGNGMVSSAFTFMNKCSSALGGFITSFVMGLVGFVANQEQSQAVLFTIVFLRFGVPILGYIASVISIHFYDITDEKFEEIRRDLDARGSLQQG